MKYGCTIIVNTVHYCSLDFRHVQTRGQCCQHLLCIGPIPYIRDLWLGCIFLTDTKRRSQISYTAPYDGIVSHWAEFGVFGFLLTTHTKQIRPRSLHTMRRFTRDYLHTQTTVDVGDICTWRTTVTLITGKTRRPPIWASCWDQNGAGSGISLVYLWYFCNSVKSPDIVSR